MGLAGTLRGLTSSLARMFLGIWTTSSISVSSAGGAGTAGSPGSRLSAPTLIGRPSFSLLRFPRKKGFSFLDLAMWAWNGPEM